MTEIQKKNIDRRTLVKGAAWSAPVLAAAVATPLAAATGGGGTAPALAFGGDCILQGAGVSLGPGFELKNNGNAPWSGQITFEESFCVDSHIPIAGNAVVRPIIRPVWLASNVLDFVNGVTTTRWDWPGGTLGLNPSRCATRTVTFNGTIAAGGRVNWGRPLSILGALEIPGVGNVLDIAIDLEHQAKITSITPTVAGSGSPNISVGQVGSLNWHLIDGSC